MARFATVVTAILLVGVVSGCSGVSVDTSRKTDEERDAESVIEVQQFGKIVIPERAQVLEVRAELRGMDSMYQLSLQTDQQGVTELLDASEFAELIPGAAPGTQTIAGPSLDTSPSLLHADDRITNAAGHYVSRSLTIDARDDQTRYVHIMVFET